MAEVDKEAMKDKTPAKNLAQIQSREDVNRSLQKTGEKKPKAKELGSSQNKKQTFGDRIVENCKNVDYEGIKDRLLFEWLFPEVISTLADILRMIFSKDGRGRARSSSRKRGGYTSYGSAYDERHRDRENRDPSRQNFRKIRLEFYEEEDAVEVLDDLRESLATSSVDYVTVRELYSLADLPTNSTMLKWGWYDLEDCRIERYEGNYVLRMPPAEVLT